MISTCISRLFSPGCPSAIPSSIRSIGICALNSMLLGWAWSYVIVKVFEGSTPLGRHGDAASTITLEGWTIAVVAAFGNSGPDSKFREFAQSVCLVQAGSLVAAARACVSALKRIGSGRCFVAADANAFPPTFAFLIFFVTDNGKSVEGFSGKINLGWHDSSSELCWLGPLRGSSLQRAVFL